MEERLSSRKATPFTLLNLGTVGVIAAWLAVACYAISHRAAASARTGDGAELLLSTHAAIGPH
jgi:hypothetical protein